MIARRFDKTTWHKLPQRSRDVFYTHKEIDRWIKKASITDLMFFMEDIGFTSAIVVFPNNKFNISDIPELSDYAFRLNNKIKGIEKTLEKEYFCLCTREMGNIFYNLSHNVHNKLYEIKSQLKRFDGANENINRGVYSSATQMEQNINTREFVLKFCTNLITELNNASDGLILAHKTILLNLREYNQVGVKPNTIITWFKGSIGDRQVKNYMEFLVDEGYAIRTGKKTNTIYMLSSKGVLFINDYTNKLIEL